MKIALVTAMGILFGQSFSQVGIFPEISLGEIKQDVGYQKSRNEWAYEAGARIRYIYSRLYAGAEAGIGRFDGMNIGTAWIDVGLTDLFINEKLRLNFGGGEAWNTMAIQKYHAPNSISKVYDQYFSPFVACDFEFWKMNIRTIYQFDSPYKTRAAVGFKIL